MKFGERLRYLRQTVVGMSQSELSRRTGVRRATIADVERDVQKGITLDTAMRLARGLGVSMDVLTRDVDTSRD